MSTLVVVAQKAHARFFEHPEPGAGLEELTSLALGHPRSAAKISELVTDSPGTVRERMGPQARDMEPEQDPKEREAERFAHVVAGRLRELRLSNDYHRAMVVAAPRFLGMLRRALSAADQRFVEAEVDKNVATHDLDAIEAQLETHLAVRGPRKLA